MRIMSAIRSKIAVMIDFIMDSIAKEGRKIKNPSQTIGSGSKGVNPNSV